MSYCRVGDDSDVYVFHATTGEFWCCACLLTGRYMDEVENWTCRTRREMLRHLKDHRRRGHKVPDRAFDRLRREQSGGR